MKPGGLGLLLAVVGLGLALMRTHLAADPKPRPRLARWSAAGASACFFFAIEMLVCWLLPDSCPGRWPFWIGGGVVFVVFIVAVSLEVKQVRRNRGEAKKRAMEEDNRAVRVKETVEQLEMYIEELDVLVHQIMDNPPSFAQTPAEAINWRSTLGRRADALLVPWKRRALDFLDATISSDAAMQFYALGSTLDRAQTGEHIESSHEEHHDFLERLIVRVDQRKLRLKDPPESSDDLLPAVMSFVYRPEP